MSDVRLQRERLLMLLSIEKRRFASFAVGSGGIAYGTRLWPFDEVDSIWFQRVHTTQYIYWSKAAECDRAVMRVKLKDGSVIPLGFNESYFFIGANINKKEWIATLVRTYVELCKATFQVRMSKYEAQLEKYGFFLYDGARFTPSDRSVVCKGKRFFVGQDRFLLSPGEIDFVHVTPSLFSRVARRIVEETIPSVLPRVSTLSDTDVFFHLLRSRMSLAWDSEQV
jgi:hypothetical protein